MFAGPSGTVLVDVNVRVVGLLESCYLMYTFSGASPFKSLLLDVNVFGCRFFYTFVSLYVHFCVPDRLEPRDSMLNFIGVRPFRTLSYAPDVCWRLSV